MSIRDEFEHIRQIAWSAVGKDIETADKALVKIHEHAKQQAVQTPASGEVEPVGEKGSLPWFCRVYNSGYHAGHHDTVEGGYTHVYPQDMDDYHEDVVIEILEDLQQEGFTTHPTAKVPEDLRNRLEAWSRALTGWPKGTAIEKVKSQIDKLLTTPAPAATTEAEWVIQLRGEYLSTRGIWERPDHRGYTNDLHEAGRYSQEEAEKAEAMAPHKYKAVCLATPPTAQEC